MVPASGGPSTRVADGTSYVWDWSAGGRGLLYLKDHSSGDIHLLDLASKRTTLFLHRGGASLFQAKYSPDYRWLSVAAIRPGMECEILIVPLHDGVPAARSEWVPVVNENVWTDKPRWSPDGNLLYFLSQRDGFLCIWAQRLESSTKRPVGAPKPVYHLHDTRLSLKNVPIASVELEVARDRLLINLGETTGNIWKSSDESITAAR